MNMRIIIAAAIGFNTIVVGIAGYAYGRTTAKNE